MLIGKVIRGYRKAEGLSVRDLAKEIGVEHTVLWRFESGRAVRTALWVKIVKWLLTSE